MKKQSINQKNFRIIEDSCSSVKVPFIFESPYLDCKRTYFVIAHLGNYHFLYPLEVFISLYVVPGLVKCFSKVVITHLIY